MRRIQLYMDDAVDDALAVEAARRGVSKASLIRDAVAEKYPSSAAADSIDELVGAFGGESDGDESIDDVVYG